MKLKWLLSFLENLYSTFILLTDKITAAADGFLNKYFLLL